MVQSLTVELRGSNHLETCKSPRRLGRKPQEVYTLAPNM